MIYIVVRTYANGKYMNLVHPLYCNWLSQAENLANRLNQNEGEYTDQKWIAMPVHEYIDNIREKNKNGGRE